MKNQTTEYALNIYDQVTKLFDKESEDFRYDLEKIDFTQFFTAYAMAFTFLYNRTTGESITHLEATHVMNSLVVQYIMETVVKEDNDEK